MLQRAWNRVSAILGMCVSVPCSKHWNLPWQWRSRPLPPPVKDHSPFPRASHIDNQYRLLKSIPMLYIYTNTCISGTLLTEQSIRIGARNKASGQKSVSHRAIQSSGDQASSCASRNDSEYMASVGSSINI